MKVERCPLSTAILYMCPSVSFRAYLGETVLAPRQLGDAFDIDRAPCGRARHHASWPGLRILSAKSRREVVREKQLLGLGCSRSL